MSKRPTDFFDNDAVSHAGLMVGQREATRERVKGRGAERLLLVQDTTSFDFKHHPATEGLGPLENKYTRGFLAHSSLVVSTDGVPLGLWNQAVWVRSGQVTGSREARKARPFPEKRATNG